MNELIPITYANDRPAVSARELHKFLEVKTKFQDWFPRMTEYGFAEGIDFDPLKIENVPSALLFGVTGLFPFFMMLHLLQVLV